MKIQQEHIFAAVIVALAVFAGVLVAEADTWAIRVLTIIVSILFAVAAICNVSAAWYGGREDAFRESLEDSRKTFGR